MACTDLPRSLGVKLHNWHGGQGDPIYAAGSTIYAYGTVSAEVAADAISNLRSLVSKVKSRKDKAELRQLVRALTPCAKSGGLGSCGCKSRR